MTHSVVSSSFTVLWQQLLRCPFQRGEVSAEVAAGLYYEERRALLGTLWRLLQARVLESGEQPQHVGLHRVLQHFCEQLLGAGPDGRLPFLGRLLHLIKVHFSSPP